MKQKGGTFSAIVTDERRLRLKPREKMKKEHGK
jgi:hypothetical protein